ncbi:unnamed protein product [Periconia digitata]|uniref:EH domain-containing protein n=1 Tax=Periconia digitata TaxID=1303443 RepID=A0A9W4UC35_9PLEO|nr:unnamed protein product [Periconia digitata]
MSSRASPQHQQVASQSTGDTIHNVPNAALRGASSAFLKPPVKPKPQANTYTGGGNGALLAATKVGTGSPRNTAAPSGTTTPLRKDWTGGSRSNASPMHQLSNSSSSSTLGIPEDSSAERIPSPSNIAAKLAAARHTALKPPTQATVTPVMSEKEQNEADVMPPPGSVGNVLARLDSEKPKPSHAQRTRLLAAPSLANSGSSAPSNDAQSTDDTPIAPTTSLVKMFEQTKPSAPSRALSPIPQISKSPPPVRSPKPQRKFKMPPESIGDVPLEQQRRKTPPLIKPKPKPKPQSQPQSQIHSWSKSAGEESASISLHERQPSARAHSPTQAPRAAVVNAESRPKPPPKKMSRQSRPKSEDMTRSPATKNRTLSTSTSNHEAPSSPASFVSAREEQEEEKPKPALPPPRRSTRQKSELTAESTRVTSRPPEPHTTPKLSSPIPPPQRLSRPHSASFSRPSTPSKDTIYHSNYQRESVKSISKHMTGESLSNAIVGAALASSRNASPSPAKLATPDFGRKQHHHHHSPFHRSPSPPKPQPTGKLRSTMRRDPSSSDEEEETDRYKRKGTRIMGMGRKHPNKHHEGTRKRWRDQITDRERKRYEGVWAANKGLFISDTPTRSPPGVSDDPLLDVSGLVVKEIWMRSRLPDHELGEVWDLVDARGLGRLRKEEFVVGMWLIDQRLKGRKLPARVSDSVWGSVRGAGVKIRVKPK